MIVPTRAIVHSCIDVVAVKYVRYIPRSVCNINRAKNDLQIHPIYLTDSDHDSIVEEIEHRESFSMKKYKG